MPHTRSAKKNLRKSEKRRLHNRAVKRDIKTQIKGFLAALDGPVDQLQKEYNLAAKKLDKAAAKRVVHPNLAARKKAQLARQLREKSTSKPA
jgi:small subunit ribosomal protein S20